MQHQSTYLGGPESASIEIPLSDLTTQKLKKNFFLTNKIFFKEQKKFSKEQLLFSFLGIVKQKKIQCNSKILKKSIFWNLLGIFGSERGISIDADSGPPRYVL